jgi:hypothetical protein
MYVDETATTATPMAAPTSVPTTGGQWTVQPSQVNAFAQAVATVRAHIDNVQSQVDELGSSDYAPRLGTSPTGQQLAQKFNDRLTGDTGLRGQLNVALQNLEAFIASAEKASATYLESDNASADTLRQQA